MIFSPAGTRTGQKEGSILHQSTAARKLLWYTAPQVVVEKRCGPSISAVPHSICISLLLKRLTFGWVPCQKALSSSTCLMPLHSWAASWKLSSPGTTLCSYQRSRSVSPYQQLDPTNDASCQQISFFKRSFFPAR